MLQALHKIGVGKRFYLGAYLLFYLLLIPGLLLFRLTIATLNHLSKIKK